MAYTRPSMFAIAMAFPSTWSSRTVPGGTSRSLTVLTNAMVSPLLFPRFASLLSEPWKRSAFAARRGRPQRSRATHPLLRLCHLRHHYILLELFHHLGLQTHFRRPFRQRHIVNLVLQLQQRIEQCLRPRR